MSDLLKAIGTESHVVAEDEVVCRSTSASDRLVRLKVKVRDVRMGDDLIYHQARLDVTILETVFFVVTLRHFPPRGFVFGHLTDAIISTVTTLTATTIRTTAAALVGDVPAGSFWRHLAVSSVVAMLCCEVQIQTLKAEVIHPLSTPSSFAHSPVSL